MGIYAKYKPSDAIGKKKAIQCAECQAITKHSVIHGIYEEESSPDDDQWICNDYLLLQCDGCSNVCYLSEFRHSDDRDIDGEFCVNESVYPACLSGRRLIGDSHELPNEIGRIYREVISSLANGLNVLTGAGMRFIVEAMCKHNRIEGSDLHEKINRLSNGGLVSTSGIAALHRIRLLGNGCSHELETNSREELLEALMVIEAMLINVYMIPNQVRKAKKSNWAHWTKIHPIIGSQLDGDELAELEAAIGKSRRGGKLDHTVNPNITTELTDTLLAIAKSHNLHEWQRARIAALIKAHL